MKFIYRCQHSKTAVELVLKSEYASNAGHLSFRLYSNQRGNKTKSFDHSISIRCLPWWKLSGQLGSSRARCYV